MAVSGYQCAYRCPSTLQCYPNNNFMRPHRAHLGPVGPSWAPCWPHEPCYQGRSSWDTVQSRNYDRNYNDENLTLRHMGEFAIDKWFTHWGWDKMAAIFKCISWMKIPLFWFKFHWNLFLRLNLTINPHWFRNLLELITKSYSRASS